MATTTSITTTYAGEFSGKYIAAALLSAPTLEKGGFTIHPNVKYKQVIQKVGTNDIIKNATCDFDATSTVTLTERILQPEEFQVNLQLCKKDFHSTWQAAEMGYSAFDVMPKSFVDFLIGHVSEKVASNMESTIWVGANATAGQFDGISTQIAADAALPSAQEVAGTTVTAANAITELGKLVDAIPARLYGHPDLKLYVSQNIYKAYVRALGGFAASGVGANGYNNQGTNQVLGDVFFPVFFWNRYGASFRIKYSGGVSASGKLVDKKIIVTTLQMPDSFKLLDMADLDGSENVRVIMRFTADAKYGFAEDMVTYGITNSAN
jgi:hypothetical protein